MPKTKRSQRKNRKTRKLRAGTNRSAIKTVFNTVKRYGPQFVEEIGKDQLKKHGSTAIRNYGKTITKYTHLLQNIPEASESYNPVVEVASPNVNTKQHADNFDVKKEIEKIKFETPSKKTKAKNLRSMKPKTAARGSEMVRLYELNQVRQALPFNE